MTSQSDGSARAYRLVSRILAVGTALAYVATFYLFITWRYSKKVARACGKTPTGDYSQSSHCLDIQGFTGWTSAFLDAIPFTAVVMVVVLAIVYLLFGNQLDLKSEHSRRRGVLIFLGSITLGLCVVILLTIGGVQLLIEP